MQEKLTKITHWMCNNPPIFRSKKRPAAENPFSLDSLPARQEYVGNTRLGFVYQELCKRLFTQHPDYEILAEEIQIFKGKQTLGAIDFLLKHQNQIEHWEVAIKFYLLKDGLWYGPDSRDRLDIKLHRMLTHQLNMSMKEEFHERFPHLTSISPKMFIQGRLYTNPFENEVVPDQCLSYQLNNSVIIGHWCFQHQLPLIKEPLYKLQKLDWITGTQQQQDKLTSLSKYAVHCQSISGQFWMIVPDTWPENNANTN